MAKTDKSKQNLWKIISTKGVKNLCSRTGKINLLMFFQTLLNQWWQLIQIQPSVLLSYILSLIEEHMLNSLQNMFA